MHEATDENFGLEVSMVNLGWMSEELRSDTWIKAMDQPRVRTMVLGPEEVTFQAQAVEVNFPEKERPVLIASKEFPWESNRRWLRRLTSYGQGS